MGGVMSDLFSHRCYQLAAGSLAGVGRHLLPALGADLRLLAEALGITKRLVQSSAVGLIFLFPKS